MHLEAFRIGSVYKTMVYGVSVAIKANKPRESSSKGPVRASKPVQAVCSRAQAQHHFYQLITPQLASTARGFVLPNPSLP